MRINKEFDIVKAILVIAGNATTTLCCHDDDP
jgi:hypothetical protein